MSEQSTPRGAVELFQQARADYGPGQRMGEVQNNMILAVGFLMGADLTYAAAAVAHVYELQFPNDLPPWS